MQTHIILIVLCAAFFHALWNAAVKQSGDKILSLVGLLVISSLLVLPLAPLVGLPHPQSWRYLLLSVGFHYGYHLCLARAYRYGDFAHAYPLARGSAPLLVTLWGVFVLHEALSGLQLLALSGVLGGIMIFASRRFGVVWQRRATLVSALLTGGFIAAYTLSDGLGGRASMNIAAYMVWLTILDCVPLTLYAVYRRSWCAVYAHVAANWRSNLGTALLSLGAYWMVVWAMVHAPIPLVSAIRETSVIIAALIGAYYFKEPAGKRRVVASVVIFVSIMVLGFAKV